MKITTGATAPMYFNCNLSYNNVGVSLTASLDYLIVTNSAVFKVIQYDSEDTVLQTDQVSLYSGTEIANASIDFTTVENVVKIRLQIIRYGNEGKVFYIDNIKLM